MDFGTFSAVEIPVVVGICACVGYCLKNLIHSDRLHDFIPTIMLVLGTILAVIDATYQGAAISLNIIFAGMASGLASTGCYEMVTHWIEAHHGLHEKPAE